MHRAVYKADRNDPRLTKRIDHEALLATAGLGWDFFAQIMFAETEQAAHIINEKYHMTDNRGTNWQRDDASFMKSAGKSRQYWTNSQVDCNLQPLSTAFQRLHIFAMSPPDKCERWIQSQPFLASLLHSGPQSFAHANIQNMPKVAATHAEYLFSLNNVKDTLTILHAQSPLAVVQDRREHGQLPASMTNLPGLPGPALSRLSNVLGYVINDRAKASSPERTLANFRKLRYVAFQSVRGPQPTLGLINTIVNSFPQSHGRLGAWPGVSMMVGDWAFDALLASTDFKGLAWLLAQRKRSFGTRTFARVWIFRADGDDEHTPSIIWQIEPVTPQLIQAAQERHDQGFELGVREGLRKAPAANTQGPPAQGGEGDAAGPSRGTKRPADQAFTPQEGYTPGSDSGAAGPAGSNAGIPGTPYHDPGAPPYMPPSQAQTPHSGDSGSAGSPGGNGGGSPGSGSGQGSSPAGSGGEARV